jgi:hypothetical protein
VDDLIAFLNARLDEDEAAAKAAADPALRWLAAARAILAEHHPTDWMAYGDHMCFRCVLDDEEPHPAGYGWLPYPCPTVRHLAAVWSDHPDYRQEWKP